MGDNTLSRQLTQERASLTAGGSAPAARSEVSPDRGPQTSRIRPPTLAGVLSLLLYCAGATWAQWPAWPGDPNVIRQGDQTQNTWNLAWTPFALLHRHALFSTNFVNYPKGMNLGQNNLAPLLGLLTLPLTVGVSPVASLNLLIWLAFPLSAISACWVLRRVGCGPVPAFVGGAVYGFSPYMVGQGLDHMIIDLVPLPPLIFLSLYELLVRRSPRRFLWGLLLGLFVTLQYFISAEIAATSILTGVIGIVVLALSHPRSVMGAVRHAAVPIALGATLCAGCVAYPVWATFAGPYHLAGSVHSGGLAADLLGSITPTAFERLAPASSIGMSLVRGDAPENGSYLGIPLIVLLILLVARYRRDKWVLFGAVMAALMLLLSLGTRLEVDNHPTVRLPFSLLANLPVFNSILEVRLTLYEWFFVACLLAAACEAFRAEFRAGIRDATGRRRGRSVAWAAMGVLAAASIVSLVPRWPYQSPATGAPAYFTSRAVLRVPEGSVVLMSPYPSAAEVAPMLWQALSGMRFRLIGGYGLFADPNGVADSYPAVTHPRDVEAYLWGEATGAAPSDRRIDVPIDAARLPRDFVRYLRNNRVQDVMWVNADANPSATLEFFTSVLGRPSYDDGMVAVWYHVPRLLAQRSFHHTPTG